MLSLAAALIIAAAIFAVGGMIVGSLDRITAEVSEISTVADSAIALLASLAQLLRDAATDPAAINALADQLDAKGNELAAAVTANTPAA